MHTILKINVPTYSSRLKLIFRVLGTYPPYKLVLPDYRNPNTWIGIFICAHAPGVGCKFNSIYIHIYICMYNYIVGT